MTFLGGLLLITALIWALLVRSKMRGDAWEKTHAQRSNHSAIHSSTSEAGHSHSYFVTKDPDEYARIFVPRGR
ncbi:hypothetical protein [Amylibacter sp. IMCC11727]|uniref:hypothetical protein n=1 Tax=Amylibacter sp. IMCC11727 TaxID=3039851 RepID=UPI00244DE18D|nr:hypothetical protein [Amylibacter sp. IMCC11727]WGI20557.1 hypothetical protein QBD29_10555 [Amylibacter sp. IMCC11727]